MTKEVHQVEENIRWKYVSPKRNVEKWNYIELHSITENSIYMGKYTRHFHIII